MSACFDWDYGPMTNDPRDPRYDDSEDLAREEWESENTYAERIGEDAVEEILYALETWSAAEAARDLKKAVDVAWELEKKRQED
jgi:hypothetical protein